MEGKFVMRRFDMAGIHFTVLWLAELTRPTEMIDSCQNIAAHLHGYGVFHWELKEIEFFELSWESGWWRYVWSWACAESRYARKVIELILNEWVEFVASYGCVKIYEHTLRSERVSVHPSFERESR